MPTPLSLRRRVQDAGMAVVGAAETIIFDKLRLRSRTQLWLVELLPIVRAIKSRPGGGLLVFGCGNDSVFWERINRGGETVFLEDSPRWQEEIQARLKASPVHLVEYGTRMSDWESLLDRPDRLELALPAPVTSRRWDVVLVDGPAGYPDFEEFHGKEAPGRMKSIYAASKLVAPGGCVFVHDCERLIEQRYAARYLGEHRRFVRVRGRAVLEGYAF